LKGLSSSGLLAGAGINFTTLGIGALIAILAVALFQSEDFRALLARLGETLMQLLPPIMSIVECLMTALSPILDVVIDLVVSLVELLVPIIDVLLTPLLTQIGFLRTCSRWLHPCLRSSGRFSSHPSSAVKLLRKRWIP
jgi:phage-related protein